MTQILTDNCRDLTLLSNHPVTSNEAIGLASEVWTVPSHRFELEYTSIPIFTKAEQRAFYAYLESLKRGVNTFTWVLPIHGEPSGTADQNPSVNTAASAGDTSITITRTDDGNDFLLPGDLIKVSNHNKVYMVMNTVNGANPTIDLNCPLKVGVAITDTVITRNVELTLRADPTSDMQSFQRKAGDVSASFGARFIEVV